MIAEDEAFWAGIAVATMMLGGGFSMLFLRTLTGEGAIVLALGLMTMALTIQLRAKPRRYIEGWSPFESRALAPTPPIESPTEPEQIQTEPETQQQPSQPTEEAAESAEQPEPEPEPEPEVIQPPEQPPEQPPAQPEPQVEEKEEPPKPDQLEEEPIVVF